VAVLLTCKGSLSEPGKPHFIGQGRQMACYAVVHPSVRRMLWLCRALRRMPPVWVIGFAIWAMLAPTARAQFQSAFVFAADPNGVAVYTRNDATGVLTPVAGSPFPSKEAVTSLVLDFKGRYLFTANYNTSKISMFTINTNTGVVQEVQGSPFASANTNTPMLLAPEITGQTLYVINFFGSTTEVSSLESFQIDSTNATLAPSGTPAVDLPGLYIGGAVHPSGKAFYGFVNNPSPSDPNAASFLVFNSASGTFTTTAFPSGSPALCFAMDPAGLHAVMATGSNIGELFTYGLNTDGTLGEFSASVNVAQQPQSMALDNLGQYLYVTLSGGTSQPSSVHVYSPISLAELASSPLPSTFTSTASWLVDPSAPLIFADQVYQVSTADGSLSSILGKNTLAPPAVFSLPPGSQPVEGPVAQLSSPSFTFGSLAIGATSSAQTLFITNTGGQNLTINTLAIGGANAGDFSEQDTCHVPTVLTPTQLCSVTITFTPSATGARSASLTLTDNAAPPSASVALTGTGLPQTSGVTLVPGSLTFGSVASPITEGTSTSSNVTVTNSGGLALHISNIALGGPNSNDFSISASGCTAAIAVNSNCSIAVTFSPLAAGLRSGTIILTDDAPDSPQTIQISGNAVAAFTVGAAAGATTAATVTAGQPATYSLQISPGAGYNGSVTLACSDAPLAATCNVPQSLTISNGSATMFSVIVATTAQSALPPLVQVPRSIPPGVIWLARTSILCVLAFFWMLGRVNANRSRRLRWKHAIAGIALLASLGFTGCGGGSSSSMLSVSPPIFTPAGSYILVVTITPASQSGKQFAAQTVQLTLTVN
jgi:HYDIN/CFA65/VesB-like, Ig-like domain/Lactonase, 7-bladed beta-propeller